LLFSQFDHGRLLSRIVSAGRFSSNGVETDGELRLTDLPCHRGQGEIFAGVQEHPASLHESGRAFLILADGAVDFC
jgi:hypothetical protein